MALSLLLKAGVPIIGTLVAENNFLRNSVSALYESSLLVDWLPKSYAAVIAVNVIGSSIVLVSLGFKVGRARAIFKEKALKDGDKDAEARFSYPKMYAEGFSEDAKKFNCVQRAHQQALETYPQFIALSLIAGIKFPVSAALGGLLWNYARLKWAQGYSKGEPSQRYEHWASYGIWASLILELLAATATAAAFVVKY